MNQTWMLPIIIAASNAGDAGSDKPMSPAAVVISLAVLAATFALIAWEEWKSR